MEAFERAHRMLYPQDRILVVYPEKFLPENRQVVLTKMKDSDYVAIYIAFSSFERLGLSREYKLEQQRELIRICRSQAANASESWERSRLETISSHLSEELMKMHEELPLDEYTSFDELGITTLVIDEAHNFKNISIDSHADSVVGICKDLDWKYIQVGNWSERSGTPCGHPSSGYSMETVGYRTKGRSSDSSGKYQ